MHRNMCLNDCLKLKTTMPTQKGGGVAGNTRLQVEKVKRVKVVSSDNFLNLISDKNKGEEFAKANSPLICQMKKA